MSYLRLRIWIILTFTLAVAAVVIRSIWQIVAIPTQGTMIIFIPLILTLLGIEALVIYLTFKPDKFRGLPFLIGITVALTAGLVAGVSHFINFIVSPLADPPLCKVIGAFVLLSSLSAYLLVLWVLWSLRKSMRKG